METKPYPYRIKTINRIAGEGLTLFGDKYQIDPDEKLPHGIIVRSSAVDTDMYPGLMAVARAGAGVNNITVEKATDSGICAFNTPGANANAVSELVFTMLGIWVRNIHKGMEFCAGIKGINDEDIHTSIEKEKSAFKGIELAGKTLGIIGLGKIGVTVANSGLHRDMNVIGFDPYPLLENIHTLSPEVVLVRSLSEVIKKADVLSIHIPLNKKTEGFMNTEKLGEMKKGAILINYARGPVIDEKAVLESLDKGHLDGYLTDFPSAALVAHPKVLASPHLGASTEESEENCATMAVKELIDYMEYGNITHSVNFPDVESIPGEKVHTRLIMINRDIPGMIGFATRLLGENGINIISYLNESNGNVGYNIIDLETPVPYELVAEIEANPDVIRTRTISY
ncbi:MAG: 3-phosphoglycerate dehydrogenase family protein [Desulfobacteraceae bacterium]|jgi:D-3-phosphoglycerate dehydrogenase